MIFTDLTHGYIIYGELPASSLTVSRLALISEWTRGEDSLFVNPHERGAK